MSDEPEAVSSTGGGQGRGTGSGQARDDDIAVDSKLLTGVLETHQWLTGDNELADCIDFLLSDLPRALGVPAAELHLLDGDGDIGRTLPDEFNQSQALTLSSDSLSLHSLHAATPQIEIIGFADPRMFRILRWNQTANGAVLTPLLDEGRLIGSFHLGLTQETAIAGRADLKLLQSLTHGVALALLRALRQQKTDELMLLDAETGVGNRRAFRRVLGSEVARARRSSQPVSMLLLKVDNFVDLCIDYGHAVCRFLMRRLAQRLSSCLRETDHISRVEDDCFGLLLPSCSEPYGHDIGERLCSDIREFAIDDRRGGVFHTTLSVGVVSWDPATLPSDSRERLVALFESEAASALAKSVSRGGNGVSISRLGALMI